MTVHGEDVQTYYDISAQVCDDWGIFGHAVAGRGSSIVLVGKLVLEILVTLA